MRRHEAHPDAAFAMAHRCDVHGVHEVDLVDHADADLLRKLRQLDQRSHLDGANGHWGAGLEGRRRLVAELVRRLNDPAAGLGLPVVLWAPVDEIEQMAAFEPAWAPLLRSATRAMRRAEDRDELGRVHDQVRWVPTIATAGRAAVEALWAELAEDAAPPLRLPRRAPADRAALLELLPAAGLERVAGTAIVLVPGSGRSMLGGVPALPAGMAWPHREQGRPLTPLAAIDCGELPSAVQGRELLPADGTLLLFADLWVDAGGYEEELGWGR